jgi:hypothetical protein
MGWGVDRIWLRIGKRSGLFRKPQWAVRFHEIREISRIAYEQSGLKKDYAQRKSE